MRWPALVLVGERAAGRGPATGGSNARGLSPAPSDLRLGLDLDRGFSAEGAGDLGRLTVGADGGLTAAALATIRRVGGVKSADICWGLPDIVALVEAADAATLQKLVLDKIQQITGVSQTATHIIFE